MSITSSTPINHSLHRSEVRQVLDRLHAAAKGDRWKLARIFPVAGTKMLMGKSFSEAAPVEKFKDIFIPVSREQGEFMYLLARAIGAKRVVEFGTSFGISTIYLAAAVRDNGGETVVGTELEPGKHAKAQEHLAEAGLAEFAEIRLGDALETLKETPEPLDLVLMDGWKDLYLPVIELLRPRLRPGAVVLADNIYTFKKSLRPYVEYVQSGTNGFASRTLEMSDGFEFSVYLG